MKRAAAVVGMVLMLGTGIAFAAETAAPTLGDVFHAVQELRADVAKLDEGRAPTANASGRLASAQSQDGSVTLEITSVLAGPEASVLGFKVTNNSKDKLACLCSLFNLSVTANGQKVEVLGLLGLSGTVAPNSSAKGLIVLDPLPKDSKEITVYASFYDAKSEQAMGHISLPVRLDGQEQVQQAAAAEGK